MEDYVKILEEMGARKPCLLLSKASIKSKTQAKKSLPAKKSLGYFCQVRKLLTEMWGEGTRIS